MLILNLHFRIMYAIHVFIILFCLVTIHIIVFKFVLALRWLLIGILVH